MFDALRASLDAQVGVKRCGFAIADSSAYLRWVEEHPDFERRGHVLLKEWEITAQRQGKPDLEQLARYESELGEDLFGAIVGDRRLIMGPDCTYSQDYRRRFTDDELLRILETGVREVERLFDELKPDLVVGFVCVTMMEYLIYLFAKRRGVAFLNLRPTRIGDRVMYGTTLTEPAPELLHTYEHCSQHGSVFLDDARAYIERVRNLHGRYEGVVKPSVQPAHRVAVRGGPLRAAWRQLQRHRAYKSSIAAVDNHVPGVLRPLLFTTFINPWRARRVAGALRHHYVTPRDLAARRYAFYPLHTEPEVSLQVYGRPFFNQLEVIRSLATSLPSDMVLAVKEHPWMVGKRSLSSYRKMLAIPRVCLVRPDVDARELVQSAALVTVLAGSSGLEAAMLRRPVLTLGHVPFNALPDCMVRRARDLTSLPHTIRQHLEAHEHDEHALEAYVASVFELSEGIQLYTTLIGRTGAHSERSTNFDDEIVRLAAYTKRRYDLETSPPSKLPVSS